MNKKAIVFVHEYDANILSFLFNMASWVDPKIKKYTKFVHNVQIIQNINGNLKWAVDKDLLYKIGKAELDLYTSNKKLIFEVEKKILNFGEQLFDLLQELNKKDLLSLSKDEILFYVKKIFEIDKEMCLYGFTLVCIDMETSYITNALQSMLENKLKNKTFSKKLGEYFTILTTPFEQTFSVKENKELLALASKIKKGLPENEKNKLIKEHWKKYCWITYGLSGPELSKKFFEEEIADLIEKNNLQEMLEHKETKQKRIKKNLEDAFKELKSSEDEKYLAELARKIVFIKGFRKESLIISFYLVGLLTKQIARTYYLPFNELRFCTPQEIINLLEKGVHPSIKELSERKAYSVYVSSFSDVKIFIGEDAKNYWQKHVFEEEVMQADEFSGQIASPGVVVGIVKVVNSAKEIDKVKEGDILVSTATQPELLPAMKVAGAIVTDHGGLTSHAAIVSRELGVPCVIGTKHGTKILQDGDLVEVDASHGVIRLLERKK